MTAVFTNFSPGLNDEFNEVRSRVTSRKALPSTSEAFSRVRKGESDRSFMLSKKMLSKKRTDSVETSAMMLEATAYKASLPPNKPLVWFGHCNKPQVLCYHCNKPRYIRETCWKIQGKPANEEQQAR